MWIVVCVGDECIEVNFDLMVMIMVGGIEIFLVESQYVQFLVVDCVYDDGLLEGFVIFVGYLFIDVFVNDFVIVLFDGFVDVFEDIEFDLVRICSNFVEVLGDMWLLLWMEVSCECVVIENNVLINVEDDVLFVNFFIGEFVGLQMLELFVVGVGGEFVVDGFDFRLVVQLVVVVFNGGGNDVVEDGVEYQFDQLFCVGQLRCFGDCSGFVFGSECLGWRFGYCILFIDGVYEVELQFVEIFFDQFGVCIFDVLVEDEFVIDDFDFFVEVGMDVLVLMVLVQVEDGVFNVDFVLSWNCVKVFGFVVWGQIVQVVVCYEFYDVNMFEFFVEVMDGMEFDVLVFSG